eukprot:a845624_47.p1 GENE.a845624_47~~a845624_47.p1  ORF type:complete len:307 (-),score=93.02 a845624_47:37-924(-)
MSTANAATPLLGRPPTPHRDWRPKVLNRRRHLRDVYFWLQRANWLVFSLSFGVCYMVIALLFVGLQALDSHGLQGTSSKFSSLLLLNINLLAGSGAGTPATTYMEVLLAVESLCQVLLFAVVTGLVYGRFSRPTARVRFTKHAVIAATEPGGVRQLMVRVTNERDNWLTRCDVTCSVIFNSGTFRRIVDLELRRSSLTKFNVPWTLFHAIDENSPLHNCTPESLQRMNTIVQFSIQGTDETQNASIGAAVEYVSSQVVFDAKFHDLFVMNPDGTSSVDLTHFDAIVPLESAPINV